MRACGHAPLVGLVSDFGAHRHSLVERWSRRAWPRATSRRTPIAAVTLGSQSRGPSAILGPVRCPLLVSALAMVLLAACGEEEPALTDATSLTCPTPGALPFRIDTGFESSANKT